MLLFCVVSNGVHNEVFSVHLVFFNTRAWLVEDEWPDRTILRFHSRREEDRWKRAENLQSSSCLWQQWNEGNTKWREREKNNNMFNMFIFPAQLKSDHCATDCQTWTGISGNGISVSCFFQRKNSVHLSLFLVFLIPFYLWWKTYLLPYGENVSKSKTVRELFMFKCSSVILLIFHWILIDVSLVVDCFIIILIQVLQTPLAQTDKTDSRCLHSSGKSVYE